MRALYFKMKIGAFFSILFALALLPLGNATAGTPSIKVWHPDFSQHHIISDETTVNSIVSIWKATSKEGSVNLPALNRELYKIDFVDALPNNDGRWLYHRGGYFVRLSKTFAQVYKVEEPEKLNALLEI